MPDDMDLERARRDARRREADSRWSHDAPIRLGKVATANGLIAAGKFLTLNPVTLLGTEAEGAAGVVNVDTSRSFTAALLNGLPQQGDLMLAASVDHRWAVVRSGAAPSGLVTAPGCACFNTTPATLFLHTHGTNPLAWNGHADTLTYTANAGGVSGFNGWLGATTFTDGFLSISGSSSNAYRYFLWCNSGTSGFYNLRRTYPSLGYNLDTYSYSWQIGLSGNTCTPVWQLTNGSANSDWPNSGYTVTS